MTDPKTSPEAVPELTPESMPEVTPESAPEVTLESALEESLALDDVPPGGRVLVISSQPTPIRRRCIALLEGMLAGRPPVDSTAESSVDSDADSDSDVDSPLGAAEIIDGGVVGEWHQGDDPGPTSSPIPGPTPGPTHSAAPDLAVLLVHHDCPQGHIHRLMEAAIADSGVAVLSVVVLPAPPDAA